MSSYVFCTCVQNLYAFTLFWLYKYSLSFFYYISIMWTYLGQNFLIDAKVRSYIADKILALYHTTWCDTLIEIWPGKGSITKLIQTISDHFFVVDMDPTFIDSGELRVENWVFILADILELDVEEVLKDKQLSPEKTLIVWNLPYYITSPILRKFFSAKGYAWWIFMVQDEVGQKIRSDAKKKSYLRWLLNYSCDVTYLKWVPAKCFKPIPKVKSCLIQLTTKNEQLSIDRDKFIEFLELFAPFSRKTLGAIQTMLNKRFATNTPLGRDKNSSTTRNKSLAIKVRSAHDTMMNFTIPESLQKKRLEELTWNDLTTILSKSS